MFMRGAIGFGRRKGLLARFNRFLRHRSWDLAFVITSVSNDIMVVESSPRGIFRAPITKYESSKYMTVFFMPEGISDDVLNRGISGLGAAIIFMIKGKYAVRDFVLFYLRAMSPGEPWDSLASSTSIEDDVFAALSRNPSFKAISST